MPKNRPTITAHCLVKNEEYYIKYAILSVLPYVDKMIIFDTGSTDSTVDIIKNIIDTPEYRKKVIFKECGNVDKQGHTDLRNKMIKLTKTDWILLVDGDEVWDLPQLQNLFKEISYQPKSKLLGLVSFHLAVGSINYYTELGQYGYPWGLHGQMAYRVIRNVPNLKFDGIYLEEGLYVGNEMVSSKQEYYFGTTTFYYHFSKLPRSSRDNVVWERKKPSKFRFFEPLKRRFFWKVSNSNPELFSKKAKKEYLNKYVWSDAGTQYYEIQEVNESLFEHSGYKILLENALQCESIVDIGCGDGSKTELIRSNSRAKRVVGVDISKVAINKAKSTYKYTEFVQSDIEELPFKDATFELSYSCFVLEHTVDPEKVLYEMLRVTKSNGIVVLLCPNYGSPNRCSPPGEGTPRLKSLFHGLLSDFNFFDNRLSWNYVEPISKPSNKHTMDYDTTVEPYLLSLRRYLESKGCRTLLYSSLWELDRGSGIHHKIFKMLGKLRVFPFSYWGPQICLVVRKP